MGNVEAAKLGALLRCKSLILLGPGNSYGMSQPRKGTSSMGQRKEQTGEQLKTLLDSLGEGRYLSLLERQGEAAECRKSLITRWMFCRERWTC